MAETRTQPLLRVRNLKNIFTRHAGLFSRKLAPVHAVDDVSFDIAPRETLGLVGESGCGKSTTGRTILRLTEPTAGQILFQGREITTLSRSDMRALRKEMQIIFQDPYSSLDPRMTVGAIVGEALQVHNLAVTRNDRDERIVQLLETVGLSADHLKRYPHEFSGGQRQRIGIARALAVNPKLVICDEAVSALDVSIQAQVINLLQDLQDEFGLTYLFIAHNLAVVEHISSRVAVMYLGKIVEIAAADEALCQPTASLYGGAAISRAAPRPNAQARAAHAPRGRAQPDSSAERLPLPHPLPLAPAVLFDARTGARGNVNGTLGGVPGADRHGRASGRAS